MSKSLFLDIFGCARQYEQALLHSLARKFALRFSAALGNMSKLYFLTFSAALGNMSKLYCTRLHENCTRLHENCTRLHENWLRLGIIQVNLASALALHKRSYKMHLWRRLGIIQVNLASALALHKRSFSIVLCSTGALFAGFVLLVSLPRLLS